MAGSSDCLLRLSPRFGATRPHGHRDVDKPLVSRPSDTCISIRPDLDLLDVSSRDASPLKLGFERGPIVREETVRHRSVSFHWITWSARSNSDGGMVSSSAFAVLRLINSSNLVGCWTGRSAGFSPLQILST